MAGTTPHKNTARKKHKLSRRLAKAALVASVRAAAATTVTILINLAWWWITHR